MPGPTFLIVDTDRNAAEQLRDILVAARYHVPQIVADRNSALKACAEIRPEMALMEVHLKGLLDGVAAARELRLRYDVPVVFVTADGAEDTLRQAREAHPFGYILRPYEVNQLLSCVQLALDANREEKRRRESESYYNATLQCARLGAIGVDEKGHVRFITAEAERITGWKRAEAMGVDIAEFFESDSIDELIRGVSTIINGGTPDPAREARKLAPYLESLTLVDRDGRPIPVELEAGVARNRTGAVSGVVLVFSSSIRDTV